VPALPAARQPGTYRLAFVCSGNICRSPSADVVAAERFAEAGLAVEVASGGIGDWHVGDPMDHRSARVLATRGYDPSAHRAQQTTASWLGEYDVLLAMDRGHLDALRALAPDADPARVVLFGDFDPVTPGAEVPDPYYGGADGFEEVLDMVERTVDALVPHVRAALSPRPDAPPDRGSDR